MEYNGDPTFWLISGGGIHVAHRTGYCKSSQHQACPRNIVRLHFRKGVKKGYLFSKKGLGGQGPFETFPKIHPFW